MITEAESGNILYQDCQQFGVDVYQTLNTPSGRVGSERIVIIPKPQQTGNIWIKNYIEVNWLVPDIVNTKADMTRLQDVERELKGNLQACSAYDDTPYRYKVVATEIKNDEPLGVHYVNARVLFQTMNIN